MTTAKDRFLAIPGAEAMTEATAAAGGGPGSRLDMPWAEPAELRMDKPDELTWWDWTVFLLHSAAEIEHALMVQYLYAAYSLADGGFSGADVPPDASTLAKGWRRTLVGIAKEEMGHLLTIQNILRLLGSALNLEREDFPFRTALYPFPLRLERLTKTSLAKYVAAEMPARPPQPPELIQEIVQRATAAVGGAPVNRVGVLYDTLVDIFKDESRLPDSSLQPDTAGEWQTGGADWFASSNLIVATVRTRADAVSVLERIGDQGEGSGSPATDGEVSHFDRLIQIYSTFPETEHPTGPITWEPTLPIADDPNTLSSPSADPDVERCRISHPHTRLWAQLFNVRYRMLLLDLSHVLHLPGPMSTTGTPTIRGRVRTWVFEEMRGKPLAGLKGLAKVLTSLPLKEAADGPTRAGPPFELPYTLSLPDREPDRWRLHLALLSASAELIRKIREGHAAQAQAHEGVLAELTELDQKARTVVEAQLG